MSTQKNGRESKPKRETKTGDGWVTIDAHQLRRFLDMGMDEATGSAKVGDSVVQSSTSGSDRKDVNADAKDNMAISEAKSLASKLGSILANPRNRGQKGMYYRCKTNYGGSVQTNSSSAGKFIVQFAGVTQLNVNLVSSTAEWSSLNVLFSEFFVHSMNLEYIPNNKYLQGYVNSTSTDWQTGLFSLAAYQHDQPAPADGLSDFYLFQNASQRKLANTGERFSFRWKNVERFDKQGPVGDASTAQHTQTWMNFIDASKYGGYIVGALPVATNAAASPSTVLPNSLLGYFVITFDVSFRYRD